MSKGYRGGVEIGNPPSVYAMLYQENQPTPYSNLEEVARSLSQACIMTYGLRFDAFAIAELYNVIEKGILKIKENKEEANFERLFQAQKNLVEFIYRIAQEANERDLTSVNAEVIKAVQFCPVYPFDNFF